MIREYKVVTASNHKDFVNNVNYMIQQGWQPFGGLVVTFSQFGALEEFYQSIVKYA